MTPAPSAFVSVWKFEAVKVKPPCRRNRQEEQTQDKSGGLSKVRNSLIANNYVLQLARVKLRARGPNAAHQVILCGPREIEKMNRIAL